MDLQRVTIVIPSLEPDEKMLTLISELSKAGFSDIIIVDDGSGPKYNYYFDKAKNTYHCTILVHGINMGKGRALKTAFNYILVHRPESLGAITVYSDGQHTIEDTLACVTALIDHPDSLIMGCRNFSKENIPFRSRFGNIVTKHVLHALCGIRISDTQTGLRGIPRRIIPTFLAINGERFEYEMNMLIETKEKGIPIFEVPIQTIYLEENKSSHFNPLKDSAKIYAVFLKFIFPPSPLLL